jgi:hypothetical protein
VALVGPGAVDVADAVRGPTASAVGYLHLHPDWSARVDGSRVTAQRTVGHAGAMAIEFEGAGPVSLGRGDESGPQGWYAERFGSRVPAFVIAFDFGVRGLDGVRRVITRLRAR